MAKDRRLTDIVRIVVKGKPYQDDAWENGPEARELLEKALASKIWKSVDAKFVVTPGGFIQGCIPRSYGRSRGWETDEGDFRSLHRVAKAVLDTVLDKGLQKEFGRRAKYLTLGVDLHKRNQRKGSQPTGTHAELVAVVDLKSGKLHWTGKSYPVGWQEHTLIHEPNLKTHLFLGADERVLVLGCHDLNMFSNRARATSRNKLRKRRWDEMNELAQSFDPTIVLHHPHETDSWRTWSGGWAGISNTLLNVRSYASSIAWFNSKGDTRDSLRDVCEATRRGSVVDVKVGL